MHLAVTGPCVVAEIRDLKTKDGNVWRRIMKIEGMGLVADVIIPDGGPVLPAVGQQIDLDGRISMDRDKVAITLVNWSPYGSKSTKAA